MLAERGFFVSWNVERGAGNVDKAGERGLKTVEILKIVKIVEFLKADKVGKVLGALKTLNGVGRDDRRRAETSALRGVF